MELYADHRQQNFEEEHSHFQYVDNEFALFWIKKLLQREQSNGHFFIEIIVNSQVGFFFK